MTKTKEKIKSAALSLFNEHGYFSITIRQIAQELGMSSGNLNYHYPKREDILEALYFDMVQHFDARVAALPQREISLSQIRTDIYDSMVIMANYRFFWTDLYRLLHLSTLINEHFNQALKQRRAGYSYLFQVLQQQGLLNPPSFAQEYQLLIERMISFSNTWLYASILYEGQYEDEHYIAQQADMLLLMLHPYLQSEGRAELLKLVKASMK
ncbi:MAG: TetR/AcrR family transcriptional regulator [Bacteroidota bacterium]